MIECLFAAKDGNDIQVIEGISNLALFRYKIIAFEQKVCWLLTVKVKQLISLSLSRFLAFIYLSQ